MRRFQVALLLPVMILAGIVIIALPYKTEAAAAHVQSVMLNDEDAFPNTTSPSFTSTSGNMLVFWGMWLALSGNCTGLQVSDSKSNSWNAVATPITDGTFCFQMYYAYNITGGSNHTITLGDTSDLVEAYAMIHEVSGILQTDPLDQSARENNEAGTAVDVGPVTTTEDGEYIYAGVWCTGDPCTIAPVAPFNERLDTGSSFPMQSQDYVQPSAGSITPAWTLSNTSGARVMMATFKAAPDSAERTTLSKPPNKLGLVGYWSFDEGNGTVATDFSGQGKHGALDGNPSWVTGKRGGALSFDGSGDQVDLPPLDTGTTNSAAVWVNFRTTPDAVLIGRDGQEIDGGGYFFYLDSTNIYYNTGGLNFATVAHGGIVVGQWYHLAVSRNGTSVTFYKNGVQIGSPQTIANTALTNILSIGSNGEGTFPLDGLLDEVRIYSRSLSAAEIAGIYGSGSVKFTTSSVELARGTALANGLVAHWTFDGPDVTTTIRDRSGNGHNAYFIGGATSSAKAIGKLGQALNFDGVDDYASSTNINALNNIPEMTISAWTKADVMPGPSTWQIIVSKMSASPSWYFGFVDVGSPLAYFVHDNSAGTAVTADISSIHKTGVWEHWVAVYNGPQSTASIYLNGVEITNSDPGGLGTVRSNSDPVRIGVLSPGAYHFDGSLDDVRLYNRALSASEVKQLYNLGAATIRQ